MPSSVSAGRCCGGCWSGSPPDPCICYVPNWVNETYHVTVNKIETAQEPYTYQVQVCKPETRSCTVKVCHFETQTRTCSEQVCEYHCENRNRTVYPLHQHSLEQANREVPYTVCVPKMETRGIEQITVCEIHQVPKSENYTVMVPHTVQKTSSGAGVQDGSSGTGGSALCNHVLRRLLLPAPLASAALRLLSVHPTLLWYFSERCERPGVLPGLSLFTPDHDRTGTSRLQL